MSKRYYWLKLGKQFFDSNEINTLAGMENGSQYILLWQRLLLKSLQFTEELNKVGLLKFNEDIPWNPDLMASSFHMSKEIVIGAMAMFQKLGMITVTDSGEMWANDIESMIGSEVDSAVRMRRHREKINQLKAPENRHIVTKDGNVVTDRHIVTISDIETEKEIDIETEKDSKKEKEEKIKIAPAVTMTEIQFQKLKDDFGEDVIKLAIDKLSNFKMSKGKQYKSDYHAILNWVIEEVAGKDNDAVKAEKKVKDEEVERKHKYDEEFEQGKLKKMPREMTRGLIDGALKKSDFLNKKEDVDNGGAKQQEEPPWGVKE